MKTTKRPDESETIDLVFLPADGGWKMKDRERERRPYRSYEARNGQVFVNWEDGEVWQCTPDAPQIRGRRIAEKAPNRIEIGSHDPKGTRQNIKVTFQYDHDDLAEMGSFKADVVTKDPRNPKAKLVEHHICTMNVIRQAAAITPAARLIATKRPKKRGLTDAQRGSIEKAAEKKRVIPQAKRFRVFEIFDGMHKTLSANRRYELAAKLCTEERIAGKRKVKAHNIRNMIKNRGA